MPVYLSPGVYVEEKKGAPPIVPVGTSVAAFIGKSVTSQSKMPDTPLVFSTGTIATDSTGTVTLTGGKWPAFDPTKVTRFLVISGSRFVVATRTSDTVLTISNPPPAVSAGTIFSFITPYSTAGELVPQLITSLINSQRNSAISSRTTQILRRACSGSFSTAARGATSFESTT